MSKRASPSSVSMLLLQPVFGALTDDAQRATWLTATGIAAAAIADRDARATPQQFATAWSELLRLRRDPHIALSVAAAIPAGSFGLVERVCRAAATVGEALRQWSRYLNLLDDSITMAIDARGGRAELRVIVDRAIPSPAAHELCFAVLVTQMRALCDASFTPEAVELTHACAGDPAAYERFFGAPVRFGAASTRLLWPLAALALPLTTADPALLAALTRTLEGRHVADAGPTSTLTRRSLEQLIGSDRADIASIARALGLAPRALQRRLKDEGTTFHGVRDALRHALAGRYLDEGLSTAEISFLLGFSEPSAFFRAFKRWSGRTPLARRAASSV